MRRSAGLGDAPKRLVTRALPASHRRLHVAVSLLLPSGDGSDPSVLGAGAFDEAAGLFLGSPLVRADRLADALLEAGFGWVCNMPTVAQHEPSFTGFLDDVAMSLDRERHVSAVLAKRGLRVLHAVARLPLSEAPVDAMLVVPTVDGRSLQASDLERHGWSGPVVALAEETPVQEEMP